jgi:chromosome segregation ATPase
MNEVNDFETVREVIDGRGFDDGGFAARAALDRIEAYCKYADQCGEELGKARAEVERLTEFLRLARLDRDEFEAKLATSEAEVERLQRVCAEWQDKCEAMTDDLHKRQETWEAEVERLREITYQVRDLNQENERLRANLAMWHGMYKESKAEVERLRAKLKDLADAAHEDHDLLRDWDSCCVRLQELRAALAKEEA